MNVILKIAHNILYTLKKEHIMSKHNSEDIRDTINKMKNDIKNTEKNYRETEKLMDQIYDDVIKTDLQIKNMRREQSLKSMKKDITNEYDKENNFKDKQTTQIF